MARFPQRAALLSLIALSSVSVSEAGLASSNQCQTASGNVFWDQCSVTGCCPRTTTVGSTQQTKLLQLSAAGEATNCCSDSQSSCGDGLTCCGYGTTVDADIIDAAGTASSCIDDTLLKCCQYQVMVPGATPKLHKARKTYNFRTHDCCANAIVHNDYYGDTEFPIVKKGQSCNFSPNKFNTFNNANTPGATSEWQRQKRNSARCGSDSDCATGTCCRRTSWSDTAADTNFARANEDAYGVCIDSGMSCCAGKDAIIEVDNGAQSASTSALVAQKWAKNARAYDSSLEQCCAVTGQVIAIGTGCPCDADSQCNNGGTCCMDESKKNSRECSATCGSSFGTEATSGTPKGCTGTCTVAGSSCWGCGGAVSVRTDSSLRNQKCCEPTSNDRREWAIKPASTAYDCTAANCCPAGIVGAGDDIVGTTCACWDDGDCNDGWTCCHTRGASKASSYNNAPGQCINPKLDGCCAISNQDNREVYRLSTRQCCPMSGVIGITNDCGCDSDGDCKSGFSCCKDAESNGEYMGKTAGGKCIHSETQECCDDPNKRETAPNVQVCFTEYEKCCNGQCCHSELDSCRKLPWSVSEAGGTKGAVNRAGVRGDNLKEDQERCQKRMTPAIVFFAWVLPVFLTIFGLAALLGAIKVAFDAALEEKGVKSLRVALIVMAALAHICLTLMLWSMFWQIAIFAMGCNIFIIAVIKTENPWARRMGMAVAFLITVIIVSPYTNQFFSFGVVPHNSAGTFYQQSHGLQAALMHQSTNFLNCGEFYQWFTAAQLQPWNVPSSDTSVVDARLHNAKHHTWGLCMWEWQQAIAVIGGLYICFQILFSMAAFAIFSRKMNQVAASKVVAME